MDTILIRDLEVQFQVGVSDAERAQPQRLLLSLELEKDFTAAVAGDDLSHTIDYSALSRRLLRFGDGRRWKLIETLASEIAKLALDEFGAERVTVEVKKFVVPQAQFVAVRVTRGKTGIAS
jgi:dihydroneopterin aldolase